MGVAIISGSAGLVGSESARFFANLGLDVVGIDNDMRSFFFGSEASTEWQRNQLEQDLGRRYRHYSEDVRDLDTLLRIFKKFSGSIQLIIHTASQPSHDWAASDPMTDFSINANGTLNLLEATRKHAREAVFIFLSTNKVYGDTPNLLPLRELESRWEIEPNHTYADGIREDMSIDCSLHSLFGVSKLSADLMVQEYGRYFGMFTACFRAGCLTGPNHAGAQLHGFLAYLMKCAAMGQPYTVFGYKGKQVRDNMHSADLVQAMYEFYRKPRLAEVYNMGGGRFSNCSMLEAIEICEEFTERKFDWSYNDANRTGDHLWWISDNGKFAEHYPQWKLKYDIPTILREIYEHNRSVWQKVSG